MITTQRIYLSYKNSQKVVTVKRDDINIITRVILV